LIGVIAGDVVTLNQAGQFASSNAGNNIAVNMLDTIGGSSAGNYVLVQPTGVTANIYKKQLTISGTTVSNKPYDGTTTSSVINGNLSGIVSGDNVVLNQSGYFASANVGNNIAVTATDTLSGASAGNYFIVQPSSLSADIVPKQLNVIGTVAANKVYDGTKNVSLSNGVLSGVVAGETITLSQSGQFVSPHAGNVAVITSDTISGLGVSNYALIQPTGIYAMISQAPLTVTAVPGFYKLYDSSTVATATLTNNALTGDNVVVNYTAANFNTANTGYQKQINVTGVAITGGANANDYFVVNSNLTTTGDVLAMNGSLSPASPIIGYKPSFSSSSDYKFGVAAVKPPASPFHPTLTGTVEINAVECNPEDNDPNCKLDK